MCVFRGRIKSQIRPNLLIARPNLICNSTSKTANRPLSRSPNFASRSQMPAATRRSRRQSHAVAPATAASSSAPIEPDEPLRQATAESAALLLEDGGLVVLRRVKAAAVFAVPQLTTPAASGRQRWLCLALHSRGGWAHSSDSSLSEGHGEDAQPGRAKVADSALPTCR